MSAPPARPTADGTGRATDRRSARVRPAASALAVHGLLLVFAFIAIAPILVVVMNSFKTTPAIFDGPFNLPNAETFSLDGYARVFKRGNMLANYQNSLVVTLASTGLTVVTSTVAAFALVEYRVRLSKVLMAAFLLGIMLPIRLGTVPILRTMIGWGLMDTLVALILVYAAMSIPIAVTVMVTYFRSVPSELKDAARIDGAGEVGTMRIALPLVMPGVAAVASITMLPVWNDLWFPLILAPSKENQTVTLGVQQFVGQFTNDYPALLAALTMGAVPLIVLFSLFSRQFISGLSRGYSR